MLLRSLLAVLVILSAYLSAVVVERTFSANVARLGSSAKVQSSDPWGKMKEELASRRRLALSRKEPPSDAAAATHLAEIEMSVIIPPPDTMPSDR